MAAGISPALKEVHLHLLPEDCSMQARRPSSTSAATVAAFRLRLFLRCSWAFACIRQVVNTILYNRQNLAKRGSYGARPPPLAAKIIERSSIPAAVVLGSKVENLRKGALGGHNGTEITQG